ncbi:alpha-tocopherol transfer protein-like [Bradysia coprophila]|uniref:alpha-tocopherol transfer protein-like n=1 Tax=Bradysia coprophila TaxID=38358 RepID=UPI00187DA0D9|nr:alpha-tocopherol transfer protein-like [Bradysia coprophila]XP_037049888.1 alpha-tocopherol transfer protein-like [Bradysia coprophila]
MAQPNIQIHSKELKEFEDLIRTKSDLPQSIDKLLLLRFLNARSGDVEEAEKLLRKNLKFRKKCPKLFNNRDVSSDAFQEARKVAQVFRMPKVTPDGYEIVVFRLTDTNPRHFITKDILRSNVTMLDASFLTDADAVKGSIGLVDLTGFSFMHFLKAFSNLSLQNWYGKFVHQAAPWKPIRVHAVHCPGVVKRFISFVGPRVRSNYMELLHFHDDYELNDEALPKEFIPNEFGGTAGSIDDLHND